MRKKVEVLKNETIKDELLTILEDELHISVLLVDSSKEILGDEEFQIPIYIDLEEYSNEKLNDIVNEYEEDILNYLNDEKDALFDLSMLFGIDSVSLRVFVKVSNRDQDNEECINLILYY